jgi:hypothetical protein
MLTKDELHNLIRHKTFMLSTNDIKYKFTNDKIFKDDKEIELASYELEVSDKGYFLKMKPFIYDTDDIILLLKNFEGYSLLLNPKKNEPHRRFIYLKEI